MATARLHVAVVLYPGCVFFEIALAVETLAAACTIGYYTPDGGEHRASNGAVLRATGSYADLRAADAAAVLIPGGDPQRILLPDNLIAPALQALAARDTVLAGICAGNLVLAACGLLRGRRGTHNYTTEHASHEQVAATAALWQGLRFERADLVRDGSLITAQPWAYRRYAAAVARQLGVLTDAQASDLETYPARRSDATRNDPDRG